jgi:hypothetical protein
MGLKHIRPFPLSPAGLFLCLVFLLTFSLRAQAGSVSLAWDPNSESDLGGYKIHYGKASGAYTATVDVGKVTSTSISNLTDGQTYYFAASAYNTAGASSGYSNEVSHQVPVPNTSPTSPSVPAGTSSGVPGAAYTFSTSATDPEGNSLQYRFGWGDGAVSGWGAGSQSHSWSAAGQYCVKAQAQDSFGALSGWSGCLTVAIAAPAVDSDGDGIPDDVETGTYGTDPSSKDTDGDGLSDGQEVALWGQGWNADIDGDGLINLLDWDADGDGFSDSEEVAEGTDPSSIESKVAALPMEAGEVTVDHTWRQVSFGRRFFNPVVVAGGFSSRDPQAAAVRIRNVTGSGFEIRIQEWECYDGVHAQESVGYLAVESGVYTLAGNLKVEAGRFVFSKGGVFKTVTFQNVFPAAPVLLASVVTLNDPAAVEVRLNKITTKGFNIRLQEQEANTQDHGAELVAYIAWPPSSGSFDGIAFEVDKTSKIIDHKFKEILFSDQHAGSPVFVGQMQSHNGGDTSGVRWQGKDGNGVDVRIAEETSHDAEIKHVAEVVGFMVFSTAE